MPIFAHIRTYKCKIQYIHKDIYLKELAYTVVGLVSVKSAGQGAGLETQARADLAVWTQNSFFSGKPQRLLLRP